jgi:hypothetical protein
LFRKLLVGTVLLALLAGSVQAKPFWKKKVFWVAVGVNLGASLVATKQIHDCRLREGIAFCDGGYGEFKAREITRGLGGIGLDFLGAWGQSQGVSDKVAFIPAFVYAGYNAYVAYDQGLKGCPAGEWPVYGTKYTCTGPKESKDWKHIRPIKLLQLTGAR